MQRFPNRAEAGRQLSKALRHLAGPSTVVLGLARGGAEVAAEVARGLQAPLDVLVARKIGAPNQPEYGIGAIAPGGITVFDEDAVRSVGASKADLERITRSELEEVDRRLRLYRGDAPLELGGKIVILVDDGLATGITAIAAARYARSLGPARLIFAVPVASSQGADLVRPEVDEFLALAQPPSFFAVGAWYDDFSQTSDREVLELLREAAIR